MKQKKYYSIKQKQSMYELISNTMLHFNKKETP